MADTAPELRRCPVCRDPLDREAIRTCPVCETPAHESCSGWIGGCARFACTEAATPRRRLAELLALQRSVDLWGWCGLAGFSAVVLAEVLVAGTSGSLGALAGACLVVCLLRASAHRLRPVRLEEIPVGTLARQLDRCRDHPASSFGPAAAVLVGLVYLGLRVVLWRGLWPCLSGALFLVGCILYALAEVRASRLHGRLSCLAGQWASEVAELVDRGQDPKACLRLEGAKGSQRALSARTP